MTDERAVTVNWPEIPPMSGYVVNPVELWINESSTITPKALEKIRATIETSYGKSPDLVCFGDEIITYKEFAERMIVDLLKREVINQEIFKVKFHQRNTESWRRQGKRRGR